MYVRRRNRRERGINQQTTRRMLIATVLLLVGVLIAFIALLNNDEQERGSGEPGVQTPPREQTQGGTDLGAPEGGGGGPEQAEPPEENRPVSEGGPDGDAGDGSAAPPEGPPQSPDPLGLEGGSEEGSSEEGSTPALENTGIRSVATKFVGAAYGYTGSDGEEYASEVAGLVEIASFPESPGGQLIDRNRDRLQGGDSLQSAARLESMSYVGEVPFEDLSPPLDYQDEGEAHEVDVRYVAAESWAYNDDGEPVLQGERTTYEQRMVFLEKLDPYDPAREDRLTPGWRVVEASLPEEV